MKIHFRTFWIILLIGLINISYSQPISPDSLDDFINNTMEDYHLAGIAACVVKDGEVVWNKNYGYANLEENIPVSDNTLFMLSSVSKTFVATAIMQLWEDGMFELDDDINNYLPLPLQVRNPWSEDEPLTFRMLLTHTSSINDVYPFLYNTNEIGDPTISLYDFLFNYL